MAHKDVIIGRDTDGWIDSAMELILKDKDLTNVGIYQSCSNARDPTFHKQVDPWTVIMNTDTLGPGEHWVLFTSVGAQPDHVIMYNSAPGGALRHGLKMAVACIAKIKGNYMYIDNIDSHRQTNSKDCRVIAIANMTALAYESDVTKQEYARSEVLLSHMIHCFEERKFLSFPTIGDRHSKGKLNEFKIELFCTCKFPEVDAYFGCGKWFRPQLQLFNP